MKKPLITPTFVNTMSKIKQVFLAEREAEQIESSFLDDAYHYEVFKSKFNKDDYEDSTKDK